MAVLSLRRTEACAINYLDLWEYAYRLPEWWGKELMARKVRETDRTMEHFEVALSSICETMTDEHKHTFNVTLDTEATDMDALRAALPFGYAVSECGLLTVPENVEGDMVIRLEVLTDGKTKISTAEKYTTRAPRVRLTYDGVALPQATFRTLTDRYARDGMVTLREMAVKALYGPDSKGSIRAEESKPFLKNEPQFLNVLGPTKQYVAPVTQTAMTAQGNRKVNLDADVPGFGQKDMLATRCTKHGVNFVRLGLNWKQGSKTLSYASYKEEPSRSSWSLHRPMVLIHRSNDGWRFVFMLPIFFRGRALYDRNMGMLPIFYMVPIFVSKQEVTFGTLTFRGLSFDTQRAIWATDGMSMAMNHALMSAMNQLKKMPSPYVFNSKTMSLPKNHRVAMLGTGRAGSYDADKGFMVDLLLTRNAVDDGPYSASISNSRYSVSMNRAVDVLDFAFWGVRTNMIEPLVKKSPVYHNKVEVSRSVRL